MHGFLNLNKPVDFTSHDCVAKVRRLLRLKRVGHGGTLDPAATGVLPIALGKATRLLQYLRQDKAYFATVRLGVCTTTDDLEGEILKAEPVTGLSLERVKAVLPQFQGTIQQIPPQYSAIQVGGKRLYDVARSGQKVEVQARTVEVYQIEVLDLRWGEFPELDLQIACGSGTYIRAIARDLGAVLQTGGTLAKLVRTESSGFSLAQSLTLEELSDRLYRGTFEPIPPAEMLHHITSMTLPSDLALRWCQGQKIWIPLSSGGLSGETNREMEKKDDPSTTTSGDRTSTGKIQSGTSDPLRRVEGEEGKLLGIGEFRPSEGGQLLVPKLVLSPVG